MKFDLYCDMHPKYRAIIYPRSKCRACLILYWLSNGGSAVVDYVERLGFIFLKAK